MRQLNPTAAVLLGFLRHEPMTGHLLAATAHDRVGDFWSVTRSQVYRELSAMETAGLVVPLRREGSARVMAVTDAGAQAFSNWLAQPPGDDYLRIPLLLSLVFADAVADDVVRAWVTRHRAAHAARLAAYEQQEREALQAGARPRDLLPLRFGLHYERAALAWFDELPDELRPHLDG